MKTLLDAILWTEQEQIIRQQIEDKKAKIFALDLIIESREFEIEEMKGKQDKLEAEKEQLYEKLIQMK